MILTDRTTTRPKGDVPIYHFSWSISNPDRKVHAKDLRFIKLTKEEESKEDEENDDNPLTNGEKRIVPINLSNQELETFTVKVTVESTLLGTRVEYEKEHSRSDGFINVEVTDAPGAYLRVYINGELDTEMRL